MAGRKPADYSAAPFLEFDRVLYDGEYGFFKGDGYAPKSSVIRESVCLKGSKLVVLDYDSDVNYVTFRLETRISRGEVWEILSEFQENGGKPSSDYIYYTRLLQRIREIQSMDACGMRNPNYRRRSRLIIDER